MATTESSALEGLDSDEEGLDSVESLKSIRDRYRYFIKINAGDSGMD